MKQYRSGVQLLVLFTFCCFIRLSFQKILTVTFSTNFEIICRVQNNKKTFFSGEHSRIKHKNVNKRYPSLFIDMKFKTFFLKQSLQELQYNCITTHSSGSKYYSRILEYVSLLLQETKGLSVRLCIQRCKFTSFRQYPIVQLQVVVKQLQIW